MAVEVDQRFVLVESEMVPTPVVTVFSEVLLVTGKTFSAAGRCGENDWHCEDALDREKLV
jgi:hypothetical protein